MQFGTRDREYTAQIQRKVNDIPGITHARWVPCGNTTFIVHEPVRKRPSLFDDDLLGFRRQMYYGAGIVNPKISIFKGYTGS